MTFGGYLQDFFLETRNMDTHDARLFQLGLSRVGSNECFGFLDSNVDSLDGLMIA